MAIKVVTVKCPECGANLPVEEDRKQIFCEYCGAKILLENDNEYIYRHIDEAEVKRAETERMLAEEKLKREREKREAEEAARLAEEAAEEEANKIARRKKEKLAQQRAQNEKSGTKLFLVGLCIGAFGIFFPGSGWESMVAILLGVFLCLAGLGLVGSTIPSEAEKGNIQVPTSVSEIETKNYAAIQAMFESAGFTNIKCVALNDLTVGLLKKPGLVSSITIGGESITSGGGWFKPNTLVVITYHSLAGR